MVGKRPTGTLGRCFVAITAEDGWRLVALGPEAATITEEPSAGRRVAPAARTSVEIHPSSLQRRSSSTTKLALSRVAGQ